MIALARPSPSHFLRFGPLARRCDLLTPLSSACGPSRAARHGHRRRLVPHMRPPRRRQRGVLGMERPGAAGGGVHGRRGGLRGAVGVHAAGGQPGRRCGAAFHFTSFRMVSECLEQRAGHAVAVPSQPTSNVTSPASQPHPRPWMLSFERREALASRRRGHSV
jgi:hypothetical protein